MKKSESIKELATALSKAQAEFKIAELDGFNPHFKSKFATLTSVMEATREALTKYGLSVSQYPCMIGDKPGLETIILHSSGEWISSETTLYLSKMDMQQFGASVTYGKRIFLAAVLGVVADEDDDGNAAVKKENQKQAAKPETPMVTKVKDVPPCFHCGSVLFYNPDKKEHYCPKYKDKKKHIVGLSDEKLEEYKVFFAENKENQMGLRMPKL